MGVFSSLKEKFEELKSVFASSQEDREYYRYFREEKNRICKAYKQNFNDSQIFQIIEGIECEVDVSIYTDNKFDSMQMQELRSGLIDEIDAKLYADPKWNYKQMCSIKCGLSDGLNGEFIEELNPNMSSEEMLEIINQRVEENKIQQQSAYQAKKSVEQANLQEYHKHEQQKMATKSMGGIDFGL